MMETHMTQECRKYERFVRDNPIASSRTTPVQEQRVLTNIQEIYKRSLFPHPPTQCFKPPVIPPVGNRSMMMQAVDCELREQSQES